MYLQTPCCSDVLCSVSMQVCTRMGLQEVRSKKAVVVMLMDLMDVSINTCINSSSVCTRMGSQEVRSKKAVVVMLVDLMDVSGTLMGKVSCFCLQWLVLYMCIEI